MNATALVCYLLLVSTPLIGIDVGGPTREAHAKLHAMMVRRLVSIDISKPSMPDTPVTVPASPADPDALRAFLRRFSVQP